MRVLQIVHDDTAPSNDDDQRIARIEAKVDALVALVKKHDLALSPKSPRRRASWTGKASPVSPPGRPPALQIASSPPSPPLWTTSSSPTPAAETPTADSVDPHAGALTQLSPATIAAVHRWRRNASILQRNAAMLGTRQMSVSHALLLAIACVALTSALHGAALLRAPSAAPPSSAAYLALRVAAAKARAAPTPPPPPPRRRRGLLPFGRQRRGEAKKGDADGDGVLDENDFCVALDDDNWVSGRATDYDGDGCRDGSVEDDDRDNDGVPDVRDTCVAGLRAGIFRSNLNTDFDGDGCDGFRISRFFA